MADPKPAPGVAETTELYALAARATDPPATRAEVAALMRDALRAERASIAAMVRAVARELPVYVYQGRECIGIAGTRAPTLAEFADALAAALERESGT